ncbi:MAG TPA: hypothetical protein VM120_20990 [Bryobacteraceae bacterium]|nr:hypothetical protein [Bryobacteraceae bacterium]
MRVAVENLRQESAFSSRPGPPPDLLRVFPFLPDDVEGIYTQKTGEGFGVWFRLKDGRIFDSRGQPSEPDPACYGETGPQ